METFETLLIGRISNSIKALVASLTPEELGALVDGSLPVIAILSTDTLIVTEVSGTGRYGLTIEPVGEQAPVYVNE